MAWGIPGNVGEIYRKQQSDELKDQLLQQEMAQRIRAFEADQEYRKQTLAAQQQEAAARREDSAANRRMDQNRLGLDEMRMTRQQMDDEEKRQQREGAQRAVSNIQGLIPFRQSPQGQAEIAGQALRVDPEQAVRELLKPSPEEEDAKLQRQREIIEKTQAKYAPPQRAPVPIVVMTPQGPQVVDRTTRTAEPITSGGQPIGVTPSAAERKDLGDFNTLNTVLDNVQVLYKPELVGPLAGRYGEASQKIPGLSVPEGFTDLSVALAQVQNTLIYMRSGKQINEQEFQRFQKELPLITDKPEVFIPKLTKARALMTETAANRQAQLGGGAGSQGGGGGGGGGQDWLKVPAGQRPIGATAVIPGRGERTWDGRMWK